jgi:hypothetical protein
MKLKKFINAQTQKIKAPNILLKKLIELVQWIQ